jgi:ABC-2 type transport system permease protein
MTEGNRQASEETEHRSPEVDRTLRDNLIKMMAQQNKLDAKIPIRLKIYAYLLRGAKTMWSYRGYAILDILATSFQIAMYFLVGQIVTPTQIEAAGYGSSYFTFALIGVAFQQFVFASVNMYSHSLHHEQEDGTIEALLTCKTSFGVYLLGEGVFNFVYATYFVAAGFIFGIILFQTTLSSNLLSILSAVVVTALLILSHLCIGIMAVGMIMKIKQGDPILWAFSWLTQLLSGVMYPLSLLPGWLLPAALAMPLTYSLDGLRRCLISVGGQSATLLTPAVLGDVVSLLIFTAIALPISLRIFRWGYNAARRDGTLHSY